jgi:hypothetical protein
MAIAIRTTLKIIIDRLELPIIPTIVYTDLYSLYKYLVKLGTIVGGYDLSLIGKSQCCQSVCRSVGRSVGRSINQ